MRVPVLTLDEGEVALTLAPIEALRAFVGGNFDQVETGPSDNPITARAIAAWLLKEKSQ